MSKATPKIGLITDDICSLPEKITKDFGIEIVKTKLFFPEAERFPERNLYQIMQETRATPKTSAPSPGDYLKAYKRALKKAEKALVITVSSELSTTYNSAFQAKELMPDPSKVIVFDSLHASASEGLLVIKVAELIREGKTIKEIVRAFESLREKTKLFACLKDAFWVEKIGRMSSRQGMIFNFLQEAGIQPIIGIKKGKIGFVGFSFWTRNITKTLFNQLKHQSKKEKIRIGINYTDNIALAHNLKEKIERELKAEVIFVSLVPPIVGANSGPGTLIVGSMPYA